MICEGTEKILIMYFTVYFNKTLFLVCRINVYDYIKQNNMPTIRLRIKFSKTAFLNTLKFAKNCACLIQLSWIYHRFPINLRLSNCHSVALARQILLKEAFRLLGFQTEHGCIIMKQMTSRSATYARLPTKTEN